MTLRKWWLELMNRKVRGGNNQTRRLRRREALPPRLELLEDRVVPATLLVPSITYPTIQSAVLAVSSGDTIQVAKGTYPEDVVIDANANPNETNFTIEGPETGVSPVTGGRTINSGNEAVISGDGNGIRMQGPISNITIEGMAFGNGASDETGYEPAAILLRSSDPAQGGATTSFTNVTIQQNLFDGTTGHGIFKDQDSPCSNLQVLDNRIQNISGVGYSGFKDNALAANAGLNGGKIDGNYIQNTGPGIPSTDPNGPDGGAGILVDLPSNNFAITNNTIVNVQAQGIQLAATAPGVAGNVTVANNTITNAALNPDLLPDAAGITLLDASNFTTNPVIIRNNLVQTSANGIAVPDGPDNVVSNDVFGKNIQIYLNSVTGSSNAAFYYGSDPFTHLPGAGTLDLSGNWFGTAIGANPDSSTAPLAIVGSSIISAPNGDAVTVGAFLNSGTNASLTPGFIPAGSTEMWVPQIGAATSGTVTVSGVVQRGIDTAVSGMTVRVASSTYNENDTVTNKSLSVIGAGASLTTISGTTTTFTATGTGTQTLTLDGLTLAGSGTGLSASTLLSLVLNNMAITTGTGGSITTVPTVTVNSNSAAGETYIINSSSFSRTNGALTLNTVSYTGVSSLGFSAGPGSDTFSVSPAPTTAITIHANNPVAPTLPGDTLTLDLSGVVGGSISPSNPLPDGMLTSTNRATVQWFSIETLSLPISMGPGVRWRALRTGAGGVNLEIQDITSSGTLPGSLVVDIPYAALSTLTISGAGNNLLAVDFGGAGDPIPAGGLVFNAAPATSPADALEIWNGNFTTLTSSYTGATAGTVVPDALGTITYSGIDTLSLGGTTATLPSYPPEPTTETILVTNLPASASTATLTNGSSALVSLTSTGTFPPTTFSDPTGLLALDRGNAADTLTVASPVTNLTSGVLVGSGGSPFASIALNGPLVASPPSGTATGTLAFFANAITVNNASLGSTAGTAKNISLNGPVTGNNLTFTADNNITLGGTVALSGNYTQQAGVTGTATLSGTMTVGGTFNLVHGTFNANGQGVTVTGLTTVSGGNYQASTATQNFNGGLTVSGGTFTGSTGTVNTSNMTLSSGTLIAPSTNMNVSGNWARTGGTTFTPNGGTVNFTSGATQTLNSGGSGGTFNNVVHNGAGTLQLVSNNLVVAGFFTSSAGTFNANALTNTVTGQATVSGGSTYLASTAMQTFNGGLAVLGVGSNVTSANGQVTVNGLLNMDSSTVSLGTGTLFQNGNVTTVASATQATISAATMDLGGSVRTFTIPNGSVIPDLLVTAAITDGGLTKNGGGLGELQLSGISTYTLATTISYGTLTVTGALNNTSSVTLGGANVTLNGNGTILSAVIVNGANDTIGSGTIGTAGSSTGLTITKVGGTGITVNATATVAILGNTVQTGSGYNATGISVSGGKALIQDDNLSGVGIVAGPSNPYYGLVAASGAIVDAGQVGGGVDFTGLNGGGSNPGSAGNNNLSGYQNYTGAASPASLTTKISQAILDTNNNAPNSSPGPQGQPYDLYAQNDNFGVGSTNYLAIEQLVYHDNDLSTLGFVNYVTPASSTPNLVTTMFYSVNPSELGTQLLTFSSGISGGTFTLTLNGQTTGPISWTKSVNLLATNIQNALAALPNVGANNVLVGGTGPYLITFVGSLAQAVEPVMTYNTSGLSGGTISSLVAFASQRSMIRRMAVAFDNYVVISAGAFGITMQGSATTYASSWSQGGPIALNATKVTFDPANGQFRYEYSFNPGATGVEASGSLTDGEYQLAINTLDVSTYSGAHPTVPQYNPNSAITANFPQGAPYVPSGSTYTLNFHRLFGDVSGVGYIDPTAIQVMAVALGKLSNQAGYVAFLNFNNDGSVDSTTDNPQFLNRKSKYNAYTMSTTIGWHWDI